MEYTPRRKGEAGRPGQPNGIPGNGIPANGTPLNATPANSTSLNGESFAPAYPAYHEEAYRVATGLRASFPSGARKVPLSVRVSLVFHETGCVAVILFFFLAGFFSYLWPDSAPYHATHLALRETADTDATIVAVRNTEILKTRKSGRRGGASLNDQRWLFAIDYRFTDSDGINYIGTTFTEAANSDGQVTDAAPDATNFPDLPRAGDPLRITYVVGDPAISVATDASRFVPAEDSIGWRIAYALFKGMVVLFLIAIYRGHKLARRLANCVMTHAPVTRVATSASINDRGRQDREVFVTIQDTHGTWRELPVKGLRKYVAEEGTFLNLVYHPDERNTPRIHSAATLPSGIDMDDRTLFCTGRTTYYFELFLLAIFIGIGRLIYEVFG